MPRGRVERAVVESKLLVGNPLGDPHVRTVPVYLPPSYDSEPGRRFPVLFVLTGFTGRGTMLLNDTAWGESLDQRMDRLIGEGCPEAILVMPDCFTRWGGSQYVNSSATGRYEDHVAEELVAWVDANWRTLPGRRGVMGKSSGGFGSLSLALRRPGVFHAVGSHSGDAYFEYCYQRDFPDTALSLAKHGGLAGFLGAFEKMNHRSGDVMKAINIVAMASCYSPDPAAPHGFVLPFDEKTGAIREETWQRWLEFDPLRLLEKRSSALSELDLLFLDCGVKDEFALQFGARMLSCRLAELGVAHEHEEFDDGHFNISYRYDVSIPKLVRALVA